MNMLMSHMADYLQLEGYKKTEGNEAQAKKNLGCEVMTDVSPGESELLLARTVLLGTRWWEPFLRWLENTLNIPVLQHYLLLASCDWQRNPWITYHTWPHNPKFIGQDVFFSSGKGSRNDTIWQCLFQLCHPWHLADPTCVCPRGDDSASQWRLHL